MTDAAIECQPAPVDGAKLPPIVGNNRNGTYHATQVSRAKKKKKKIDTINSQYELDDKNEMAITATTASNCWR